MSPYTARQRAVIDDVRFVLRYDPADVVVTAARLRMSVDLLEVTLRRAGRVDLLHRLQACRVTSPREWRCGRRVCRCVGGGRRAGAA